MENQGGSSGTGVPTPASGEGQAASAVTLEMLSALEQRLVKQMQSEKDKRFAKNEGRIDQLMQRFEELTKDGLSPQRAKEWMAMEDRLSQLAPDPEPNKTAQVTPGTGDAAVISIPDDLLRKLGIDPTNSDVASALSDLSDGKKVLETLAKLAPDRSKANPAQQMPVSMGSSVAEEDIGQLSAELMTLSKHPSRNWKRIEEINQKLSEQTT
jgi:hypothetical protein